MGDDDNGILDDHQQHGSTFVPPLVHSIGDDLQYIKWQYEALPDFLGIALLLDELSPLRTVETLITCSDAAAKVGERSAYILLSEYDLLTESQMGSLKNELDEEVIDNLESALAPLIYYYPSFPLSPLTDGVAENGDEYLERLQRVTDESYNRRSRPAMLTQGAYAAAMLATGKMKVPQGTPFDDINDLMDYPETENSRLVASSVRASINAMVMADRESLESDWITRFWQRGFEISECLYPQQFQESEEISEELVERLVNFGQAYEYSLRESLIELWERAETDPKFTGKTAVLDGLLMRQVNFITDLANTPSLWSRTMADIIIRCMTDTQILMEWFYKVGDEEDYMRFIDYGLGQEKLALEHGFASLEESEDERANEVAQGLEGLKRSLEEQKYTFLIPVDVGSWNKNTRELAIEADCKDLYDQSYSPQSATIHGMWNALEKQNLTHCVNPLHKYHRIPEIQPPRPIPFALVPAGNVMNRSLETWFNARDVDPEGVDVPDLSATVREELDEFEERNSAPDDEVSS